MKHKILSMIILLTLPWMLTSCRVNWFNKQYDVPWWMVTVPVVILVFLSWIITGKRIAKKQYVCPKCNHKFHPKWQTAALSIHINSNRVLRCPRCNRKGFCRMLRDWEDQA